jgi:hypothetical protein
MSTTERIKSAEDYMEIALTADGDSGIKLHRRSSDLFSPLEVLGQSDPTGPGTSFC